MRVAIAGFGIGSAAVSIALARDTRYTLLSRALSPFFQSSHRWLGPARDVGLPILTRLPPTRAIMERVLAGRG